MIRAGQLTLSFGQVCEVLGYSRSTCRRLMAGGVLPGPINPALSPKCRRWSRRLIEEYAGELSPSDPAPPRGVPRLSLVADHRVAVDTDPTPAHGLERSLGVAL